MKKYKARATTDLISGCFGIFVAALAFSVALTEDALLSLVISGCAVLSVMGASYILSASFYLVRPQPNEYQIVAHSGLTDMEHYVRQEMKEGWVPLGGVCESAEPGSTDLYYSQAMVRFSEEKE